MLDSKVSFHYCLIILSFVFNSSPAGSERKTDLDKAYTRIVDTIFNNILRCATEQQKNPKDVVMMENYHHMYDLLARFKVGSSRAIYVFTWRVYFV